MQSLKHRGLRLTTAFATPKAAWGHHKEWCPGPDLNRHGRNGRGILSSLHYGITRHNPR